MDDRPDPDRDETEKERLDRNLTELVGELRVALPGVQVLFAFLLTVPFNQRFGQVTDFQKNVYLVTLLSTAVSTALLLAPSALHRIEFRQDDKKHIVQSANRYAIAGFAFLMASVTGAVLLVTDFLYSTTTSRVATFGIAALLATCWYALPLLRRARIDKPVAREPTATASR
jgi:Flp pilus assembly protein TadB